MPSEQNHERTVLAGRIKNARTQEGSSHHLPQPLQGCAASLTCLGPIDRPPTCYEPCLTASTLWLTADTLLMMSSSNFVTSIALIYSPLHASLGTFSLAQPDLSFCCASHMPLFHWDTIATIVAPTSHTVDTLRSVL